VNNSDILFKTGCWSCKQFLTLNKRTDGPLDGVVAKWLDVPHR